MTAGALTLPLGRSKARFARPRRPKTPTPSVWDILRWNLDPRWEPGAEYEQVWGGWWVRVG